MTTLFSILLAFIVFFIVKDDNLIWSFITFITSLSLLVIDDSANYFKYNYKG